MEKYGFIYIWYDRKRKMYYIGSHWGSEDDGYICSSNRMRDAYRRRPDDFKRRVLLRIYSNRKELLEHEEIIIKKAERKKNKYYNLHFSTGHWHTNEQTRLSVGQKISKALTGKPSSNLGLKRTEESKQKMRNAWKNRSPMTEQTKEILRQKALGLKRTEETCIKIGNIHRGKKLSEETKLKISNSKTGKKLSEETRQKISNAAKMQWQRQKMINMEII